jgi:hypothetical protein
MRGMPRLTLLAVLFSAVLAQATHFLLPLDAGLFGLFGGSKPQTPPGWMLRKQSISLENTNLKAADHPCDNWSWVAGIVDMAAASGVRIEQQYLIDRIYGGSLCLPSEGDPEDLAKQVSHDYVLPDGQKFRLMVEFRSGAPTQADPLIVALRQNRPLMLLWRSHAYLLIGMNYDEYIAPTGHRMFMITELKLFDPAGKEGERQQSFLRDRDDPNELNGIFVLSVYPK